MNIRLYFCRRANENMDSMTKDTFVVKQYADTGLKYVVKRVDDLTKNHRQSDREKVSGHMPADENCPGITYNIYIASLVNGFNSLLYLNSMI